MHSRSRLIEIFSRVLSRRYHDNIAHVLKIIACPTFSLANCTTSDTLRVDLLCSLARRRNIMLHHEDEGIRRPLMHVHIRYRLRGIFAWRVYRYRLLQTATPRSIADYVIRSAKKERYDSFGKSAHLPSILSIVENLRLTVTLKTKSR